MVGHESFDLKSQHLSLFQERVRNRGERWVPHLLFGYLPESAPLPW